MRRKIAVIVGAGPAGLTAAYELLEKTDVLPLVFEMSSEIGGISRTVDYKGNKMDIGGHRFFSKSDRVVAWWTKILPLQGGAAADTSTELTYQRNKMSVPRKNDGPDPEKTDKVMLVRERRSRIYFLRKFFDYPLSLGIKTLADLGFMKSARIIVSYLRARLFPIRPEASLRDFLINRFGTELYLTFFRSYTEKVWGVPCDRIRADWGAQRIKSLSLQKALLNQVKGLLRRETPRNTPTSLIERFMYPKFGPGQMWNEAARIVVERGGTIQLRHRLARTFVENGRVTAVEFEDASTGRTLRVECDYLISTMPVKDLIRSIGEPVPAPVREAADGLIYRDFITVGVLLKRMRIGGANETGNRPPDNWIYIQERDVKVGRLQIFNNWSPYLVRDPETVWIGMEYFCQEGDEFWERKDADILRFAVRELVKMGMASEEDFLDGTVVRMQKTYPAYFGTYSRFPEIREYTDGIENLFLIGRNGMHRYNNQDHSMLTAMAAVENIAAGVKTKDNIWSVNIEDEYHEDKSSPASPSGRKCGDDQRGRDGVVR